MKTVALIVGHSQKSQGASNANGMTEWAFNHVLANLVANRLMTSGMVKPVLIHRDTYSGLPDKVNKTGSDIAVSFHANAFNTEATGSEVLYWHTSKDGRRLADIMQFAATDALGLTDRGIKTRRMNGRGAYILHETAMPCVIVEPFFIDNSADLKVAMEKQCELAKNYAHAIEGYFR